MVQLGPLSPATHPSSGDTAVASASADSAADSIADAVATADSAADAAVPATAHTPCGAAAPASPHTDPVAEAALQNSAVAHAGALVLPPDAGALITAQAVLGNRDNLDCTELATVVANCSDDDITALTAEPPTLGDDLHDCIDFHSSGAPTAGSERDALPVCLSSPATNHIIRSLGGCAQVSAAQML